MSEYHDCTTCKHTALITTSDGERILISGCLSFNVVLDYIEARKGWRPYQKDSITHNTRRWVLKINKAWPICRGSTQYWRPRLGTMVEKVQEAWAV